MKKHKFKLEKGWGEGSTLKERMKWFFKLPLCAVCGELPLGDHHLTEAIKAPLYSRK